MSDVFISYARATEREAKAIGEALRAAGYSVWRDDEIPAHRSFADVIEERLTASKAVVVVWSTGALTSEWVRSEANRARADRKLIQLRVDEARPPMPFDQIQCADLIGWAGEPDHPGWMKVAASVGDLVGGQPALKAATAAAGRLRRAAICVLPFANISGDPEQEYFSDGISEDTITDLSKVSALDVTARNTAFTFKGRSVKAPDVARELGVSHILEGSVRKAGNRVRITAQLIDGATGNHVWAERWDRDLTDIFALQDEISEAIVSALKVKLLPQEKKAIAARGTKNPEAYDLFLMARDQMAVGNVGDTRREAAVIRYCQRATELDPAYARAWAVMAWAQSSLAIDRSKGGDDGLVAAERAEALDPTLGAPHAVKAKAFYHAGRNEEALGEIERAIDLEPNTIEVNWIAGIIYFEERRWADAARVFARNAKIDEANLGACGMQISCYLALGDEQKTRAAAEITLERAERALAEDRTNGFTASMGVMALAALGETERAKQWIDRWLLIDPDNLIMQFNFACALSIRAQDVDGALKMLTPVLAGDNQRLIRDASTTPDFDPIRADSRFQRMLAEAQARIAKAEASA